MRIAGSTPIARWRNARLATRTAVVGATAVGFIVAVFVAAVLAVSALGSASASEGRTLLLVALIGLTGSSLLLVALVWFSISSVARPLLRLSEAAQRLRIGEEATVPEAGSAEIKALAVSFNAMASELKARERQLGDLSRIDPLTGVANRRGFEAELLRALAASDRGGGPVSLLMIDIDRFKDYNDEYGHIAGDAFLKEANANWLAELRLTDTLARYGGEEFAVILPNCSLDHAFALGERLRAAVPHGESCSIGAATYVAGESARNLTWRADSALMIAKRRGRDRTHAAVAGFRPVAGRFAFD